MSDNASQSRSDVTLRTYPPKKQRPKSSIKKKRIASPSPYRVRPVERKYETVPESIKRVRWLVDSTQEIKKTNPQQYQTLTQSLAIQQKVQQNEDYVIHTYLAYLTNPKILSTQFYHKFPMFKNFKDQEVFAYFGDSQHEIKMNAKKQLVFYKTYEEEH